MKFKILIILILLTFFLPIVHSAYADYGVNEIIVPQSIRQGEDLNYSMVLSNNSSSVFALDVGIYIISPAGSPKLINTGTYNITANNTTTVTGTIHYSGDYNFSASNDPYSIYASITNEGTTGNVANNTYTKYFTVKKNNKKIPVPDMPIVLGMVLAISVVFILARGNGLSKKKK